MENNATLVKVKYHFGESKIWVEATSSLLAFYDFGVDSQSDKRIRCSISTETELEKQRAIDALLGVAEFLESKLGSAAEDSSKH
jgi:hypothetical protein